MTLNDIKLYENNASFDKVNTIINNQQQNAYRKILDLSDITLVEKPDGSGIGYVGVTYSEYIYMLSLNGYIYFQDHEATAFIKISDLANKVCTFKDPPAFTRPSLNIMYNIYNQIGENRIFIFGNESDSNYSMRSIEFRYNSENNTIEIFHVIDNVETNDYIRFAMPPYNGKIATKSVSYLF